MDRINVDGLRTFLAVAHHAHLGHAAEALGQEQSTVSRKIARLEEEVGVALFERVRRSIRLTPAGNRFVPRAERILHDLREAIADAEGAVSAESGEVRIGFLHTVGPPWPPQRAPPLPPPPRGDGPRGGERGSQRRLRPRHPRPAAGGPARPRDRLPLPRAGRGGGP